MGNRYQAFDPDSKVIGASVQGYVGCIRAEEIDRYIRRYNLTDINPGAWYSLQMLLDLLTDIHEEHQGEAMFDFVSIGMKALEMTPFPPEVEALSFEQIIMAGEQVYASTHQGNAGYVRPNIRSEKHIVQQTQTPYPDDLMYGAVYGMAKRFLPKGTRFTIKYDETTPRRDRGGEVTTFDMTW